MNVIKYTYTVLDSITSYAPKSYVITYYFEATTIQHFTILNIVGNQNRVANMCITKHKEDTVKMSWPNA